MFHQSGRYTHGHKISISHPFFFILWLGAMGFAVYQTYINLYLTEIGLTVSEIGFIISISTIFTILTKMLWGILSDRAKTKNRVVLLLYLCSASVGMLFYLGTEFWLMLVLVTAFSIFSTPIPPLLDNLVLESLEKSKWDYSHIRLGATLGYCITVLAAGFILQDKYESIFWMTALMLLICSLLWLKLPKIQGYRKEQEKTRYRDLFKNKALLVYIGYGISASLGLSVFYQFYPIYFVSIGGNSATVGILTFIGTLSEIPIFLLIRYFVRRYGDGLVLIVSGIALAVRWMLMFLLSDIVGIMITNLLHGVSSVGFLYCIVVYIGKTVPPDLRATAQLLNVTLSTIVSRMIFGYINGLVGQHIGIDYLMLFSGIIMVVSTLLFWLWHRKQPNS